MIYSDIRRDCGERNINALNTGKSWPGLHDKWTRCSAIAERTRCRVRYSFGQKWKTGTGRIYLRTL